MKTLFRRFFALLPMWSLIWAVGFVSDCQGCNVPVFRYALEQWQRDEYRLVIATKGGLAADVQPRVVELARHTSAKEGFCNLDVQVVDVSADADLKLLKEFPAMAHVTEPTAFLLYPEGEKYQPVILQEPFVGETIKKLVSSAFVDQVMMGLLAGDSAVWVLVDSGNQAADEKALAELNRTLEILKNKIELPRGVIQTSGEVTGGFSVEDLRGNFDPDDVLASGIPLKIDFAVARLTKDQAEPVLRAIMMNCESDLGEYLDQPMVFPVFGRGRMLYPMIGAAISGKNIAMAGMYICGRCSCQAKAGNPGVDLLSHVDWASYLAGSEVVIDRELPPLMGTADLVVAEVAPEEALEIPSRADTSSPLGRNMVGVFAGGLAVMLGATFVMIKRVRH
jgi:hypothetical protein